MYKKILLGIDISDVSMKAAEYVIALQKKFSSETVIFHSALHHLNGNPPNLGYGYNTTAITFTPQENDVDLGRSLLKDIEELFRQNELYVETRLIFDISPEEYIKKQVEEENFNLVVLGYHGTHSVLGSVLLGSVPNKVINHVQCDVLIVK